MHQMARIFVCVFNPATRRRELVEVSPELAAAYREKPPKRRERFLRDPRAGERLETRVVLTGSAEALAKYWGGPAMPPEGPTFQFAYFIGHPIKERVTQPCPGHEDLPEDTYTLCCDRSGLDRRIGLPTPEDLARRPPEPRKRWAPEDGLRGGRGD